MKTLTDERFEKALARRDGPIEVGERVWTDLWLEDGRHPTGKVVAIHDHMATVEWDSGRTGVVAHSDLDTLDR